MSDKLQNHIWLEPEPREKATLSMSGCESAIIPNAACGSSATIATSHMDSMVTALMLKTKIGVVSIGRTIQDKPNYCFDSGCPLANKSHGFTLGTGDPTTAKFAIILEAPGRDEIAFRLDPPTKVRGVYDTKKECDLEIALRRRDYPELDEKFIKRGVCVVGRAGALMWQWLLAPFAIKRNELFVDNVLRCLPPRSGKDGKGGPYPTGEDRKQAERCCRHYDRFEIFRPDTLVLSMHPSALAREVTPLTLCLKDVEKAKSFAEQGRRVMLLLGGKAAHAFARFGENITRWRGDYIPLDSGWILRYKQMFETIKKTGRAKKVLDDLDVALGGGSSEVDMAKESKRKTRKRRKKTDAGAGNVLESSSRQGTLGI